MSKVYPAGRKALQLYRQQLVDASMRKHKDKARAEREADQAVAKRIEQLASQGIVVDGDVEVVS